MVTPSAKLTPPSLPMALPSETMVLAPKESEPAPEMLPSETFALAPKEREPAPDTLPKVTLLLNVAEPAVRVSMSIWFSLVNT
ncbi:MAG: hypothetical protein J6J97_01035, partial [Akkermansia sp.]|nr:hypothetical protein [Akkermansia sp.]